jgi:anti-anti-sigma factor
MEITADGDLVRLEGDLDLCSARMVDRHDASVFDVSGVTFMDCAGIAALVRARDRALARGDSFTLEGVGAPVARVLEATRLASVFTVPATHEAPRAPAEAA